MSSYSAFPPMLLAALASLMKSQKRRAAAGRVSGVRSEAPFDASNFGGVKPWRGASVTGVPVSPASFESEFSGLKPWRGSSVAGVMPSAPQVAAPIDPATFGGVKPWRVPGEQLSGSVAGVRSDVPIDPASFGGSKRPATSLGASVAAVPGETWDPSVGLGGVKPGRSASVAGVRVDPAAFRREFDGPKAPPMDSGSVAGVKSDTPINPYSFGGAKPWTVADARLSGSVAGAVPTSGPNFDPKTGQEIKSWDTEALRKQRPKPPLVFRELLPSTGDE